MNLSTMKPQPMTWLRQLLVASILSCCWLPLSYALESLNINQADASTIAENLAGIGEKRAQAIVEYRQQHGPFSNLEDLVAVKGVGQKMIDNNKEVIIFK